MRTITIIAALLTAIPAAGATLRSATTVSGPEVRVADLFDDAGAEADRVLGPGPKPGGRIVVEAAQASAIARQFGVAWRPRSGIEQVVIDRAGVMVPREAITNAVRAALHEAGVGASIEVEIGGFVAPLVAPGSQPQIAVEQLDREPISGRFTASLAIAGPGEALQRMRLSGRTVEMTEAVVATHHLAAGEIIRPEDVRLQRIIAGGQSEAVAQTVAQTLGLTPRRPVMAGQSLMLADLAVPVLVQKNALVQIAFSAPGLSLTATGTAIEPGGLGARIGVLNPLSGAIVDAEVIGPDQVRVLPGSALRRPARGGQTQISAR